MKNTPVLGWLIVGIIATIFFVSVLAILQDDKKTESALRIIIISAIVYFLLRFARKSINKKQ